MSMGLALLRAMIEGGASSVVRELHEDLFVDDEIGAYDFLRDFYRNHGGLPTIQVMTENGFRLTPAEANVSYYLQRVRNRAIYHTILDSREEMDQAIQARDMEGTIAAVRAMNQGVGHFQNERDLISLAEATDMVDEDYQASRVNPGMRGITFGWDVLDNATGGAENGDLITVVARPGVGKTWTMLHMALAAWQAGHSVLFTTMEMTVLQITRRMVGLHSGINPDRIRRGEISMWGEEIYQQTLELFRGDSVAPFNILAGSFKKSPDDVDALMQELTPDICYVDAGYLMKPERTSSGFRGRSQHEVATEVVEQLKGVAANRNRPLIQSVQFNRDKKRRGDMDLDQISRTDAIGQISSVVLGIDPGNGSEENTQRRYRLVKSRDGETGLEFTTNFLFDPVDFSRIVPETPENENAEETQNEDGGDREWDGHGDPPQAEAPPDPGI